LRETRGATEEERLRVTNQLEVRRDLPAHGVAISVPEHLDHPSWTLLHERRSELPQVQPPAVFVRDLARLIGKDGENNIGLLLKMFYEGRLSRDQVKAWVKQWYYQARAFPSLIAQLIASSAGHYGVHERFSINVYEELGAGNPAKEHPLLLRNCAVALGASEEEVEFVVPYPETLLYVEYRAKLVRDVSFVEAVACASYVNELTIPGFYRKVAIGLREQFGLSEEDCEFFWVHVGKPGAENDYGGDIQHADEAAEVLARYATTAETQERCRQAVWRALQAKKVYWNGLLREIVLEREAWFSGLTVK
jgi:pyrroloquinoline quinone (PQQ) biosynthesis protein C